MKDKLIKELTSLRNELISRHQMDLAERVLRLIKKVEKRGSDS